MARPRQHPLHTALTSGLSCVAVVGGLLAGAAPMIATASPAAAVDGAGIESLGPIPVRNGSGPVAPEFAVSVIRGGVALSPRPVLLLSGDSEAASEVEVSDLSVGRSKWTWVGQARAGRLAIARDLTTGHAYLWRWRTAGGEWKAGGSFVARFGVSAGQATMPVGAARVSPLTGEVGTGWSSGVVNGPGSSVAVSLGWRGTEVAAATGSQLSGMPAGWTLSASTGSSWSALTESDDTVVRGVAPAPPRVLLVDGELRAAWRYPAGAARGFTVQARNSNGRWVNLDSVRASSTSEVYDVSITAPTWVELGDKVRVVARVGKGDLATRYVLTSGVEFTSEAARVQDRAVRGVLRPAAPVEGSGSGGLVVSGDAPRSVTVWGWDASALTFVRNASGVYEQVLTASSDVQGARNSLNRRLVDGVWAWEFTDLRGVVTTFVGGHAVSVAGGGMPISFLEWSGDRLVQIRPAGVPADSPHAVGLVYSGSGVCPSSAWTSFGFAAVPEGQLCRVTYGNGIATDFGYVAGVRGGAQIALIKETSGDGQAYGWDSVGRLVAMRSALVSRSSLVDPTRKTLVSSIDYDNSGRVASTRQAAAAVGANQLVQTFAYPRIDEAAAIAGATVTARVDTSAGNATWSRTIDFNAATQSVISGLDRAGMRTTFVADPYGRPQKVIDSEKRITTFTYDDSGIQTGQAGPFAGDATKGLVTNAIYDGDVDNGRVTPWTGMQARVYPQEAFGGEPSGGWWGKEDRSALGYSWRELPDGSAGTWSARASAQWTPTSDARDWSFRIDSNGAVVSLLVEGELCATDNAGRCDITGLPSGPKAIVVQVDRAGERGGFRILASPQGSEPALVPAAAVVPMFGLVTSQRVNDVYPGSDRNPQTIKEFSEPWSQRVASVTRPGGLTTLQGVEDVDPQRDLWGRPLSRTTPGGRTVSFGYYAATATVAPPDICGGGPAAPQYGGIRTITRQDGTSEERIGDAYGQLVASITRGEQGAQQTTCLKYDDAGTLVSRRVFTSAGELIESTSVNTAVDGKPWITSTTVTHGPGSPVAPGQSITTTTEVDMAGRVVRFVDGFGTVTTTSYTAQAKPRTVIVTAPASAGSRTLRLDFTYTALQNWLDTVKVNGVQAAKVNYDEVLGRIDSVVYADGVSIAYDYFGNGQARRETIITGSGRVVNSLDLKGTGRTMGSQVTATGADAYTESRDYGYDASGRLISAVIASTQTGLPATTSYTYSYGAQAASCGSSYTRAGMDSLRSGGSRNGVAYTTCHDADGRTTSTTDPLLTGGSGTATLRHDKFGRVTRVDGASDITLTWGADSQLAVLADGATRTVMNTFSGLLHTKSVTDGADPTSTIGYGYSAPGANTMLYSMTGRTPTGVASSIVGLPGGATLTLPSGSLAVITLSDLEGSALVTAGVPSLGAGAPDTDLAPAVGPSPRFGPYGEALVTPTFTSAVPHYQWQHSAQLETLPGASSITIMGARPYLPALGEFLAKDPDLNAGNNLYSFTGGDVVNAADWSGGSEGCGFLCWGLAGGGAIAALFGPAGALVGAALTSAAVALSVMAAKANGEAPISSAEVIFSSAALLFAGGKLVSEAIGSYVIYRYAKKAAAAKGGGARLKAAATDAEGGLIRDSARSDSVDTNAIHDLLRGKSFRSMVEETGTNARPVTSSSQNAQLLGQKSHTSTLTDEADNFLHITKSQKNEFLMESKFNNKSFVEEVSETSSELGGKFKQQPDSPLNDPQWLQFRMDLIYKM